jgi:hypothetical protein
MVSVVIANGRHGRPGPAELLRYFFAKQAQEFRTGHNVVFAEIPALFR